MKIIFFYLLLSAAAFGAPYSPFHETNLYVLGGQGAWDYLTVDSEAHQLYLARGDRVMIVDTDSGKLLHEITGLKGVHGVALDRNHGRGYISDGGGNRVAVFDLKSLKVIQQIKVGQNPDAILYDFIANKIFAFNAQSKDFSVIDLKDLKVVATVPLDDNPEFAVSDATGKIFVNLEGTSTLARVDARTFKVESKFPLGPSCQAPTGLSIDPKSRRLFVGCSNGVLAIVDAGNGKVVKTFPVGRKVDGTVFDAKSHLIFVSAGEGKVSIFHESGANDFEFVQTLTTAKGARTVTFDSETGKLFLVTADYAAAPSERALPGTFKLLVYSQ